MKRKAHATVPVVIKAAEVDVLMAPLVNWLNAFEETATLHCCQGETEAGPDGLGRAYVQFICTSPLELTTILECFAHCATVEISWTRDYPLFRYCARFNNRHALGSVLDAIRCREKVR